MPLIAQTLDEALAPITDGCVLLVPRETAGVAMAATRALIRRGVKRLDLVTLPTATLQADLLIGAGCVASIETSAVSLGEFGPAPRFTAAVTAGAIRVKDATCPALYAALQATEKGVPFMPMRGLIGSDILKNRPDWRVIDNPFGNDDPIVLVAAAQGRRRAVPCADGGPRRQRVDRHPARARPDGARGGQDDRHRGENPRRQSARRSGARGRHARRLLCRDDSRSRRAAPGRCRCPTVIRRTARILPSMPALAATAEGFAHYLDRHVYDRRAA